jgi:hypothetical protein
MAKTKSPAKKLSRREVILLGSGAVFAPLGGSAIEVPPPDKACGDATPMKGVGSKGPVLAAYPCCKDGLKIFQTGFQALKSSSTAKQHLTQFNAALATSSNQLMDYCVMVWGLDEGERKALIEQVQGTYKLAQIK